MLDIKYIRENPSVIQKSAQDKNISISVDHLLKIDATCRELQLEVQRLREERNINTSSIKGKPTDEQLKIGREIKNNLEKQEQIHALGFANLINILNPEIIILGGGGAKMPNRKLMESLILSPLAKNT